MSKGHHHLLHEPRLPFGRDLVHAEVAGLDAEAEERPQHLARDDQGVAVVEGVTGHRVPGEQPVPGELVEVGGRPGHWHPRAQPA